MNPSSSGEPQPDQEAGMADWLRKTAADYPFPPTPDLASAVRARLHKRLPRLPMSLRRAVPALLLALALMAVPDIRAAVMQVLRVGAVRILPGAPRPEFDPGMAGLAELVDSEITLEQARAEAFFRIPLPAASSGLGTPDHVYRLALTAQTFVLVWDNPEAPVSLHVIGAEDTFFKHYPGEPEGTRVNGMPAYWLPLAHPVEYRSAAGAVLWRLVTTPALVWFDGVATYRLEGAFTLDEARSIAESLR